MAWRPNGSDAWIVIQQADLVVRLTIALDGMFDKRGPHALQRDEKTPPFQ